MRRLLMFGFFGSLLVLLAGCNPFASLSPEYQAYSSLGPAQLQLVIPDTAHWAHGSVCPNGGDCSGPMTAEWIQTTQWVPVAELLSTEADGRRTDVVMTRGTAPNRYVPFDGDIRFQLWGADHHGFIGEAIARDLELWVGYLGSEGLVLAFDNQGRVASIGSAGAAILAEPLVRLSLSAGESPYDYFTALAAGPAPEELLTAADPGLPIETFEPRRIFRSGNCVTFGRREGLLLVFPEGTVEERNGRNAGVDVLGGWSGLETIPFNRSLSEGQRIEIDGQRTTAEALGVSTFLSCSEDVIFVNEIRVVPAS